MLQAVNIKWDTDGDEKLLQSLPSVVNIPEELLYEDEISDYLSEKVGFCHGGFNLISVLSDDIKNIILSKAGALTVFKCGAGAFEVDLQFVTPSDEDIHIKLRYDGTDCDLIEAFQNYANKFDINQYASGWNVKGKYQEQLINDAHWIKYTLTTIAENLQNILTNNVPQVVTENAPKTDQWNYVDEVGNPKKEGSYLVTLIYPEWWNGEKTGRQLATTDIRYFRDLGKPERNNVDCTMDGEPTDGLAWLEECGSIMGERVYAWQEMPPIAKLPDGVVIDEDEDE